MGHNNQSIGTSQLPWLSRSLLLLPFDPFFAMFVLSLSSILRILEICTAMRPCDDTRWQKTLKLWKTQKMRNSTVGPTHLCAPACKNFGAVYPVVRFYATLLHDDVNRLNTSPRWNLTSVAPGIKAQISVESSAPSRFHNSHYNRCSVQNASVELEAMFPPLALEILPSLWSPWCPPRESRRAFCHAGHRLRAVSEWLQWSDSPQVMVFWCRTGDQTTLW